MKKKIISLLLAVITVMHLLPWSMLPIIAEGDEQSVIGAIGKLNITSGSVYMYESVYEYGGKGRTSSIKYNEMPAQFVILDVYFAPQAGYNGRYYYKLGQVDGGQYHTAFDATPWINGELVEIISYPEPEISVEVTYNGKPVEEISLYEDGKMPITAKKPTEIEGEVKWAWEIKHEDNWIRIGDKTTDTCDISYALVVNLLDENDQALVRAVACDGENEYPSEPITVTMTRVPKPMEQSPLVYKTEDEAAPYYTSRTKERRNDLDRSTNTESVTITVNFIKIRPDGTRAQAAYPDIRTLKTDYEAYAVTLPSVLGYYPSLVAPSNPYDFAQNPARDPSLTTISVEAGLTSDKTINVYYYPGEAKYTVYHYVQNVYDDNYVPYSTEPVTEKQGTVGTIVPDSCHLNIKGFQPLYYERMEIATDGSTVIEIYYDREYFTVLFDLAKPKAHGQENLYVKYETEVGINDPTCAGWTFSSWEKAVLDGNGNITDYVATEYTAGRKNLFTVVEATMFRAVWEGSATTYSVVYWLENPNDGNYSVWYTENDLYAISGGFKKWNGVVPEYISKNSDYAFVSLNTTKTEADWDDKTQGVLIEGDGSSTVDVYFNRRVYNIDFLTSPKNNLSHNHNNTNDPCIYNTMHCTDPSHTGHTHTSACGSITCTAFEHMHSAECCNAHMHTPSCYGVADQSLAAGMGADLRNQIINNAKESSSIWGWIVDTFAGSSIESAGGAAAEQITTMAPPQNLQNGYVYVIKDKDISFEYKYIGFIKDTYNGKHTLAAIYIDGNWYTYTGTISSDAVAVDPNKPNELYYITKTTNCTIPDHDHTSGCSYGNCTLTEHVHINSCYKSCLDTGEQHTADCYGNVCMKPVTKTYSGKTGVTDGTYTVISIQAKYGQDITDMLPYYIELGDYGLNKNANGDNFTGWKYAGTGWAQTNAVTRYVKHVTMVAELCYSSGVTAMAQYDPNANNAYLLYYLFESFDQTSGSEDYDLSGGGRQQYNGVWYDSNAVHMQLIMLPSDGTTFVNDKKDIHGMTYVGMTSGSLGLGLDLNLENINSALSGIESKTVNAYFYNRNIENKVIFHNGGKTINTILTDGQSNPLKFGLNLGDLATALKNSAEYGYFDVNTVPHPSTLEANAYVFDGWYTTPYQSDYTKVDWNTSTLPEGELNLYAYWKPVTRYVTVYEDATKQNLFDRNNYGYQEVGHRSFAIAPDYSLSQYTKDGYKFNGWFYVDPISGEEKAFLFNFPVTQNLEIYAKWTLDIIVPYEIHYKVEYPKGSGNYVKVADSLIGTAVAGHNKTFRAATGTNLYEEFSEGFFPQIGSHTLQMQVNRDDKGNLLPNVYEFIYDEVEEVKYWVQFVNNETGEAFDYTDERYPKTIEIKTRKAAVTELFVPIEGYTVDKYSKSLIISTNDPEINNVITFYYTEIDEEKPITAPWIVNHLIQNADGITYSHYQQTSHVDEVKSGDDHSDVYYGTVLTNITGYKFATVDIKTRKLNPTTSEVEDIIVTTTADGLISVIQNGVQKYGYELTEYGMEINLYYDRLPVGYTVEYKAADTGKVFYSYTVNANNSVPHGQNVTAVLNQQEHVKIVYNEGYQLVDDTQTSITMTLYVDESRNVITFLYQKFDATFEYQIVCDDEANAGVGLSMTREVIAAGSPNALIGAIPYESETYYFAGWFADAACTKPINADTVGDYSLTLNQEDNRLIPTKTEFTYEGTSGNLYLSATYYALFLPRSADLQILVNSGNNDTFILTLTGKAGTFAEGTVITVPVVDGNAVKLTDMPIGEYTVTADANWSWRYEEINATATVVVKDGGSITINATIKNDQWITSDSSGVIDQN